MKKLTYTKFVQVLNATPDKCNFLVYGGHFYPLTVRDREAFVNIGDYGFGVPMSQLYACPNVAPNLLGGYYFTFEHWEDAPMISVPLCDLVNFVRS